MSAFITPIALVAAIGFISAIILTLAAHFMSVPVDETEMKIREILPGANCGACGYAGCDDYAQALANDPTGVSSTLCIPGGATVVAAIGDIIGVSAEAATPIVAAVQCEGKTHLTKQAMDYQGYKTCASVKQFFGGPMACKFGCIGYGDCVDVCRYDAICIRDGVAIVDRDLCTGCTMCAQACPQDLIAMVPATNRVFVACSSEDSARQTRNVCEVGCIACRLCEKACKFDAIHVENNVATIDPEKCTNCGLCVKACPRDIITLIPRKKAARPPKAEAERKTS